MQRCKGPALLILLFLVTGVACAVVEPWRRDPDVRAAKAACNDLDQSRRYACVERHAVDTLNPDVCRLSSIFVDDLCLQMVYEAAGDRSICGRLFLEGVRPNCEAYYDALPQEPR